MACAAYEEAYARWERNKPRQSQYTKTETDREGFDAAVLAWQEQAAAYDEWVGSEAFETWQSLSADLDKIRRYQRKTREANIDEDGNVKSSETYKILLKSLEELDEISTEIDNILAENGATGLDAPDAADYLAGSNYVTMSRALVQLDIQRQELKANGMNSIWESVKNGAMADLQETQFLQQAQALSDAEQWAIVNSAIGMAFNTVFAFL